MKYMNDELKNKIMIVSLMVAAGFTVFGVAYAKKEMTRQEYLNDANESVEKADESPAEMMQEESSEQTPAQQESLENNPESELKKDVRENKNAYPVHKNITATFFWIGEDAGRDNMNISNVPSAWDEQWMRHYGGIDTPKKRRGYMPTGFIPRENPFYFALPYNDFDENGKRKKEAFDVVPWAKEKDWKKDESMLKNRWIKIAKNDEVVYAQWQDVGPFKEDDSQYVFGKAKPQSTINDNAGLDVSPAVRIFLRLSDIDQVDWQFVDEKDVPDGPWKKIITNSQLSWN